MSDHFGTLCIKGLKLTLFVKLKAKDLNLFPYFSIQLLSKESPELLPLLDEYRQKVGLGNLFQTAFPLRTHLHLTILQHS